MPCIEGFIFIFFQEKVSGAPSGVNVAPLGLSMEPVEESTPHCLTVSEQNDSKGFDQLLPDSHSRKYCHHFKLLDDGFLSFGHYFCQC